MGSGFDSDFTTDVLYAQFNVNSSSYQGLDTNDLEYLGDNGMTGAVDTFKTIVEAADSFTAPTRTKYADVFSPAAAVTVRSSPVVGKKEAAPGASAVLSTEFTSSMNALAACPHNNDQCGD